MKKVTFAFLFILMGTLVNAQDYKKVESYFLLRKVEDAKTEFDKMAADPKVANSLVGNLWKARINGAIYADTALRVKYPNSGQVAMDAFRTYLKTEPDAKTLKAIPGGMAVVDNLYATNFNIGYRYFNQQQWDSAYTYFTKAYEMGQIITERNWKNNNQTVDTLTLTYAGFSAQNAKKTEDAVKYYEQIADKGIAGKDYQGVYEYLLYNYLKTKNEAQFNKYLPTAKKLYPSVPLWNNLETAFVEENSSLDDKLKKYDEGVSGGKMTAEDLFTYGNMFANVKVDAAKNVDSSKVAGLRRKAVEAFQKAYDMDKTNALSAYNAGILYNNEWLDLTERFRLNAGASPALKAKRDAIDKEAMTVSTNAIEWLEKFYAAEKTKENRTKIESNSLNRTVDLLANFYAWKRDKSRGKNPKDVDLFDAKFKQYDVEHGKYK